MIIKEELPIDLLEFFCLTPATPFGGSPDALEEWRRDGFRPNRYDVEHVCTAYSKMSKEEWQDI
jgi:hypothetical protein